MKGILHIIATPIGNLEDITLRALSTLKESDLIACEDTRVTSKLLSHYNISKPLVSLHQHSGKIRFDRIISELNAGKKVAYASDAGTPGISDPGNKLVAAAIAEDIDIIPIPGVSALTTLISVAGVDMQQFVFLGFPPHKKGREKFFKLLFETKYPAIYYDSPHRILKNIELLKKNGLNKHIIIGREMTKLFEEIIRGNFAEVSEYFTKNPSKLKGEFKIIIY